MRPNPKQALYSLGDLSVSLLSDEFIYGWCFFMAIAAGHPSRLGLGSLVLYTAQGLPGRQDQRDDATQAGHDLTPPSGGAPPPAQPSPA